jgi:YjbE family integral membrane protein
MLEALQAIFAIVLIDLALSGDNALVIGMAARGLPPDQRRTAIVLGGVLAVALRVAGTALVTLLLLIPYLQLAGGLLLVVIAYRLVTKESGPHEVRQATSMREAIATIVAADAAMSLENVLGVGAAAHGDLPLLLFGLALSIPIVLFGSGLVVGLLERWPSLIWLAAFALVWTAADMILEDPTLAAHVPEHWAVEFVATAILLALVAGARTLTRRGAMVR